MAFESIEPNRWADYSLPVERENRRDSKMHVSWCDEKVEWRPRVQRRNRNSVGMAMTLLLERNARDRHQLGWRLSLVLIIERELVVEQAAIVESNSFRVSMS